MVRRGGGGRREAGREDERCVYTHAVGDIAGGSERDCWTTVHLKHVMHTHMWGVPSILGSSADSHAIVLYCTSGVMLAHVFITVPTSLSKLQGFPLRD